MHRLTWEDNGVYWQCYDTLIPEDIIRMTGEVYGDARLESRRYVIIDLTEVAHLEVDAGDVRRETSSAKTANARMLHVKVAYVATDEELVALLETHIQQTQEIVPHSRQRLFDSLDEARVWAEF